MDIQTHKTWTYKHIKHGHTESHKRWNTKTHKTDQYLVRLTNKQNFEHFLLMKQHHKI